MSSTIEQFVERLTQSGLMTAQEIDAFHGQLPPEKRPKDVQQLAQVLVKQGKLTEYQARAVYQGKTKHLVFGEYVVLEKLGEGGMGVVFKARHRRMKRYVAIKVISSALKQSADIERFHREVEAAAKLSHTNIVTAHDAGEHQGMHYLVMEYIEGRDLASLSAERVQLPVREAVELVLQAARGLQYAHQRGVVHRDVKPGNLMLEKSGTIKILDMGLARVGPTATVPGGPERLTDTGQVMGTCDYMSPEQAANSHDADHRTDIYALGCTLYRLLSGKPPYRGETLVQVLLAHRNSPIPSLCAARPDAPESLDAICVRAMAKNPKQRYQSMAEVVVELEAVLAALPNIAALESPRNDLSCTDPYRTLPFVPQGKAVETVAAPHRTSAEKDTDPSVNQQDTGTRISGKTRPPRRRPLMRLALVGGLLMGVAIFFRFGPWPLAALFPRQPVANDSAPPPAVAPFGAQKAKEYQEAWAKHLGVPVEITNSIGMRFVLIPPGEFMMGSPDSDNERPREEKPQHKVRVTRSFYLSMFEVTQGQWETVMGDNPSNRNNNNMEPNRPVDRVGWDDCQRFLDKLNAKPGPIRGTFQLPTEAQWEYACLAGSASRYCFGDDDALLDQYAWFRGNSGVHAPRTVGARRANAWGLFDMHGNVWEHCADFYDKEYYSVSPVDDPSGPPVGSSHVKRGGFCNGDAKLCRSACRSNQKPDGNSTNVGLRVAFVLADTTTEQMTTGGIAKAAQPSASSTVDAKPPSADDARWTPWRKLFDGKTFDGWHLQNQNGPVCWTAVDGQLICTPPPSGDDLNLVSDEMFRDFELQVDFLLEDGANSGIFLRGLYEVQLYDDNWKNVPPKQRCGAIWNQVAPSEPAYLGPGKWNTLNVKLVGQHVTVNMNGKRIVDEATLSGPTSEKQKLQIQEGDPGPVMLQCMAHGRTLFRNISIRKTN